MWGSAGGWAKNQDDDLFSVFYYDSFFAGWAVSFQLFVAVDVALCCLFFVAFRRIGITSSHQTNKYLRATWLGGNSGYCVVSLVRNEQLHGQPASTTIWRLSAVYLRSIKKSTHYEIIFCSLDLCLDPGILMQGSRAGLAVLRTCLHRVRNQIEHINCCHDGVNLWGSLFGSVDNDPPGTPKRKC